MRLTSSQLKNKLQRNGRLCLSWVAAGLRALLVLTLLMTAVRDSRISPLMALGNTESEDSSSTESEQPDGSQESPKGSDEVVPPRQRGDRLTGRSAPLPYFLPRAVATPATAPVPRLFKLLPGGRHADRNGLGVPLRC